jgi:hypothetical protein
MFKKSALSNESTTESRIDPPLSTTIRKIRRGKPNKHGSHPLFPEDPRPPPADVILRMSQRGNARRIPGGRDPLRSAFGVQRSRIHRLFASFLLTFFAMDNQHVPHPTNLTLQRRCISTHKHEMRIKRLPRREIGHSLFHQLRRSSVRLK